MTATPSPNGPHRSDLLASVAVPANVKWKPAADTVVAEPLATLELKRQYNELQAIYRMSDAVARAGELEEIYSAALDELQRTVGADRASVLLFDSDNVMRFKSWRGLSDEYRKAVEGHSPWSPDESDPQPILVPDVTADPSMAGYRQVFEREGIKALGFIPLVDAGKLLGKFMIYFDSPHVVQPAQVQLAHTIASHIAFAISRKRSEADLRDAERAQRKLAEAAQEANFAKSQFLAMMSHELRTPLNAIGGYAELLEMELHGSLNEEQRKDVSRIQKSQRHLLGLINDLLSFAKIETGHIALCSEVVSLEDALVTAEEIIAPAINAKLLRYRRNRSAAGISCRGDRDRIGQVLLNLMSNAVKFTSDGKEMSIDWVESGDMALVHIADKGLGIPQDKLEMIFQPFVQLKTRNRLTEGTGLGLSISRELARAMGGDITVTSKVSSGSTFTFSLPRA